MIFGEPLDVGHIATPTNDQVREQLDKYMQALRELWEDNKEKYAKDRVEELTFL